MPRTALTSHATSDLMAEFQNEIRLAVDSGKTALGYRRVLSAVITRNARLVVIASKAKEQMLNEARHLSRIAGIKVSMFDGNPVELGSVCGKPFSVSMLAVIEPGNSSILGNAVQTDAPSTER